MAMALSVLIAMISAMALGSAADFYARNIVSQTQRSELKILESTLRPEWQLRINSFKLTNRIIEFVTAQPRESGTESNVVRVNYECKLTDQLGYTLLHTSVELSESSKAQVPALTPNLQEQRRTETVLLDNLKVCNFAALKNEGTKTDRATMRWVSEWGADDSVPKLIRLQISLRGGDLPNYVFVAETS